MEPPDVNLYVKDDCNCTSDQPQLLKDWCEDFNTAIHNHQSQASELHCAAIILFTNFSDKVRSLAQMTRTGESLVFDLFAQVSHLLENIRKHEESFRHLLSTDKVVENHSNTTRTEWNKRQRRGLVDGVGKGMRYLFGTAVDDDVQIMKAHLKFATSSYKKMKSYQHYLNSYLVKTNRRVDNAINMLNFNHGILQHAIHNITDYRRKVVERLEGLEMKTEAILQLMRFSSAMVARMSQVVDQLSFLERHGARRIRGAWSLVRGRLPLHMVTPSDLRRMAHLIRNQLHSQDADFRITASRIGDFYSQASVSFAMNDEYLAIQVKVPISNLKTRCRVFRVIVASIPLLANAAVNGNRATKIENVSPYFAAVDGSFYTELQQLEHLSVSHDPRLITLKPWNHSSCASALYAGHDADIKQLCRIRYHNDVTEEPLTYPLGNGSVVIRSAGQGPWFKTCGSAGARADPVAPCQFCVIDVSCCELLGSDFYVPFDLETCGANNRSSATQIIHNLPFLSLFKANLTQGISDVGDNLGLSEILDLDQIDRQWKMALEIDTKRRSDLEALGWLVSQSTVDTMEDPPDHTSILEDTFSSNMTVVLVVLGVSVLVAYVLLAAALRRLCVLRRDLKGMTKQPHRVEKTYRFV